jgi:hypothetical protein
MGCNCKTVKKAEYISRKYSEDDKQYHHVSNNKMRKILSEIGIRIANMIGGIFMSILLLIVIGPILIYIIIRLCLGYKSMKIMPDKMLMKLMGKK